MRRVWCPLPRARRSARALEARAPLHRRARRHVQVSLLRSAQIGGFSHWVTRGWRQKFHKLGSMLNFDADVKKKKKKNDRASRDVKTVIETKYNETSQVTTFSFATR